MLPLSYYAQDAETVARDLLGKHLLFVLEGVTKRSRVVETEAYVGEHDLACHAAKGRTKRTEVMFGPPGHAYIYLIYGMYDLLNVVTGADGDAEAVLIRAAEPLNNIEGRTDGPGRLTRTLGLTRSLHGAPLCGPDLWLEDAPPPTELGVSPRVGIDYAGAWKDAPLRFFDKTSRHVSKPR